MKNFKLSTEKGEFVLMEIPTQLKELNHGGKTKLMFEEKQITPIEFLLKLTDKHCENVVDNYGPFGEFKGGVHPSGGSMRYRAYGSALTALKCILEDNNISFKNAYLFKINDKPQE